MINLGGHSFKTQKAAEEYVRGLIKGIGFCGSIRGVSEEAYRSVLEVLERHPNKSTKLFNMVDLCIRPNQMNRQAYEINVIRSDGTREDISWKVCITGKAKTKTDELYRALRYSINEQLYAYKQENPTDTCRMCHKTAPKVHIDHIIHFECLVENFLRTVPAAPASFNDATDGSNRRCFRPEDEAWERAWQTYHERHATLRAVCQQCNLRREKYRAGSVVLGN
jgi:hypothetical protein